MGRDRYQEGSLVIVGKRVKKWRGHFYVYQKQADGSENRRLRNVLLGLKSEMDKGQAKQKLREMIARETRNVAARAGQRHACDGFTKTASFRRRKSSGRSHRGPRRSASSRTTCSSASAISCLADLDKFTLQTYLNELAPNFSKSVLAKMRVYLNSILDEAVELEFLPKNPAAKLVVPRSGKKAASHAPNA